MPEFLSASLYQERKTESSIPEKNNPERDDKNRIEWLILN